MQNKRPNKLTRAPPIIVMPEGNDVPRAQQYAVVNGGPAAELLRGIENDEKQYAQYKKMPEHERVDIFWGLVAQFNWCGALDGAVTPRNVAPLAAARDIDRYIFKKYYKRYYTGMEEIMTENGMFERGALNGADMRDKVKVISHAIALGRNQFYDLCADMEILQFLIENNECQSLDDLLPDDLRINKK